MGTMKKEDNWTTQQIGTAFPPQTVKPAGHPNVAVALWYRHGMPVLGQAWNESGRLQCSFACEKKVVASKDVEVIQLLQFDGDHTHMGFYYEWIPYTAFANKSDLDGHICAVVCGYSMPLFWIEKGTIGYLDKKEGRAYFAVDGKCLEMCEKEMSAQKMEILVRNSKGGPPSCQCTTCQATRVSHQRKLLSFNEWDDVFDGIVVPEGKKRKLVKALNRPLKIGKNTQEQFVMLWYLHGKPVMGRGWLEGDKLRAVFVHSGRKYTGQQLGSFQALIQHSVMSVGFEYTWLPYEQARRTDTSGTIYTPVQIASVVPCVIVTDDQQEVLGSLDMHVEVAEGCIEDKNVKKDGGAIKNLCILCRKDREDIVAL